MRATWVAIQRSEGINTSHKKKKMDTLCNNPKNEHSLSLSRDLKSAHAVVNPLSSEDTNMAACHVNENVL